MCDRYMCDRYMVYLKSETLVQLLAYCKETRNHWKNHIPAMIQRICIKSWDSNVNNLSNTCLLASTFSKWLQNITLWKWHSLHNLSEMEGWNKTTMIITNPKSNDRTIKGRPSFTAFSYLSLRCCIPFQVLPKYILSYMAYIYF